MSDLALHPSTVDVLRAPVVSLRDLVPWAVFVGALMLVLVYFVGAEQGAASIFSNHYVHEFFHDGRHLLGFPCH